MSDATLDFGVSGETDHWARYPSGLNWSYALHNSPECVLLVDSEGTIVDANRAACEALGQGRQELREHNLFRLAADESRSSAEFRTLLSNGRGSGSFAVDGSIRQAREFEYSVAVNAGPDVHVVFAREVTERNLLRRQLLQSQKLETVGRLASGVAHDFNNMLTVILGYGELLSHRLGPQHALQRYAQGIVEAADRSSRLTRQLLSFGREQTSPSQIVDLNTLVRDLEPLIERLIGEEIHVTTSLAPSFLRVSADPVKISQVLMNLVVNARDAMPSGGRLHIETASVQLDCQYCATHISAVPGRYVMMSVTDSGSGMDPEVRARIFEPYFTTKEQGKGTGLGLATVQKIVQEAQGYIWLYSEVSEGSTFKVYLPAIAEKDESQQLAHPVQNGTGETILVIEDEDAARDVIVEFLVEHGFNVIAAGGGDQALALCETNTGDIHLMLSDVVMRGTSGEDISAYIACRFPMVKTLYMSGFPHHELVSRGVIREAQPVLQKPFRLHDLLDAIHLVLSS